MKGFCDNCDNECKVIKKKELVNVVVKGVPISVTLEMLYCSICKEEYYDRDNAIEHDNVIYGEYERKIKEK